MTEETRSLLLNVKNKYGDRSIALGMEPGQPGILEDYPRPKQQVCLLSISESAVFFSKTLVFLTDSFQYLNLFMC